MRRILSIMLMALILGLSFSAAVSQSFVLAEVQDEKAYEDFWNILNKEAELIVKLNSTTDADEIQSLALQLIQNSQNGSSNAAQISALIWQSLEELKNSGVKTYYTAEELRQMAQNITQNGLPNETVQLLKEQGWSDEEIQALQEYIVENSENITEDFNLTKFLKDFSQAFIQVAFKYNHYEAWAVRKLVPIINYPEVYRFEPVSAQVAPSFVKDLKIPVPIFETIRIDELSTNPNLTLVENAKNEVFKLLSGEKDGAVIYQKIIKDGSTSCRINDNLLNIFNRSLTSDNQTLNGIKVVRVLSNFRNKVLAEDTTIVEVRLLKIGKKMSRDDIVSSNDNQEVEVVVQTTVIHVGFDNNCIPQVDVYEEVTAYSWDGLKAYEKLSNLETLLQAKEFGNHDEGINEQINSTATEISQYFTLKDRRVIWSYSWSIITIPIQPKIETSTKETPLNEDSEGYLAVSYSIVPEDVTSEYATYKVRVGLTAENNVVNDVSVTVDGTELKDSTHYSMIHPDDGTVTWTSKESGKVYGNNEVTVSGTIKVTYTPHCGDLPTSKDIFSSGASPLSCNQPVTITKNYSTTISLTNNIDPDKVNFYIIPSDSRIRPGRSVTFYVKVVNENDEPVSGSYELHITVPTGNGYSEPITKEGYISVGSNDDSGLIPVTTITYTDTGTYGYSGTFKFNNGYEKQDNGNIVVDESSTSTTQFSAYLEVTPTELEGGGVVIFTVKATNYLNEAYSVKGYVVDEDGVTVKNITATLPADAYDYTLTSFSLQVSGVGTHTYTLFLDNYDGNPGGLDEEHWNEVRVIVKSCNQLKPVASECDPLYFKYNMGNYEATLTCRLMVYNGYNSSLLVTGNIISDISASILNKYLQFPVVSYINPETLPVGGYATITSTAHFKISKPDIFVIGDIFPYWEDAYSDIQAERVYGAMIPIKIIHDVHFDKLGIQRFTLQSNVYVEVDHIAVVADFATDTLLTYKLRAKSIPIANIRFIQDALDKFPPEVREKISPFIEQISINWLANWIKEKAITWWRG